MDAPDHVTDDASTARMVRQILAASWSEHTLASLPALASVADVRGRTFTNGKMEQVENFSARRLVRKRAELAGEIERTHEALKTAIADLTSLDATFWRA